MFWTKLMHIGIALSPSLLFGIGLWLYRMGFKHGQIKAINGDKIYELREYPNHTTKWKMIQDE